LQKVSYLNYSWKYKSNKCFDKMMMLHKIDER